MPATCNNHSHSGVHGLLLRVGQSVPEHITIPTTIPLNHLNGVVKSEDTILECKTFSKASNADTVTYVLFFDENPNPVTDGVNELAMEALMPIWERVGMRGRGGRMYGNFILMAMPKVSDGELDRDEAVPLDMTLDEFTAEFSSERYDWKNRFA